MTAPQNPRVTQADAPFVAVEGQSFASHQHWVIYATRRLTAHPDYNNTEHNGPAKGWRGPHFTAMCFDQKGRRCRNGGDFRRAEDESAFPVWWVWPDQIAELIMAARHREAAEAASKAREARLVHIAADLLQHLDWLTCGLPALLETGGLTDEEGLIGAAVDAANSARAALTKEPDA